MSRTWREGFVEKVAQLDQGDGRLYAVCDTPIVNSIRVGGCADLLVKAKGSEAVVWVLAAAQEFGQPVHTLGRGANTIIGDGGVPGVLLKLDNELEAEVVQERGDELWLDLSAGAPSSRLVQMAKRHGLLGAEWAAGIPGTLGGLAAMNAGTRSGEMKDRVREVLLASPEGASWFPVSELAYAYRHSELKGRVVTRIRLAFKRGSPEEVEESLAAMKADMAYRRNSQPLNLPNSGSAFRNPPGDFSGRLIEACGLKGRRLGNAQISEKHANFVVNLGEATAADVTGLLSLARKQVQERFGVKLELENRLIGRFEPSLEDLGLD